MYVCRCHVVAVRFGLSVQQNMRHTIHMDSADFEYYSICAALIIAIAAFYFMLFKLLSP
ncbi:hypothetical protein BY998_14021 [Methylobacterium sp. B4]|nr:hypothetical protein BY998_14021 [Methylobacterium sp. B4]